MPSTVVDIMDQCSSAGPKQVLGTVSQKLGGVVHANSPSELPRNERQVMYFAQKKKSQSQKVSPEVGFPASDQIFAIMQSSKLEDDHGKFVQQTRPAPEPAFVVARDRQLDDLVRFCTPPDGFTVLTVDPTFNLGEFDVTPITYRHCLLKSIRTGTPPVFIGPIMIHYRKNFSAYLFFASTLIGLRRDLQALRAFGTDGEKALADAFSHEFRYAVHLTCFIHCRSNIKQKLQELSYPQTATKEILDDIFGCQEGSTFYEGLVGCENDDNFDSKCDALEARWLEIEKSSAANPGFHSWFLRHKAAVMKTTMLKNVRAEAGLGSPSQPFTTNASETTNSIIKAHVSHKSSKLMELVNHLKDAIDEQEREVERAVIGRGKYRFKDDYAALEICEAKWFKMSIQQRQSHLKKVATVGVVSNTQKTLISNLPVANALPLDIDVESVAASVTVPLPCLQGVWKKATELISSSSSIAAAPGQVSEARMVESRGGQRPHLVVPCKRGIFKCDNDCLNYKSIGICSHVVAVAHLSGSLSQLISAFTKYKKKPDYSKLATHGMPSGRGRKGGQAPRKRKKVDEVTECVQRQASSSFPSSVSNLSPAVGEMHSGSMLNFSSNVVYPYASPPVTECDQRASSVSNLSPAVGEMHSSSMLNVQYPYERPPVYPPVYPPPRWVGPYCSPQNYNYTPPMASSTPPMASSTPPMAEQSTPFSLCFITGNISKCTGCGNKYGKPVVAPYDLCVQHREWRSFSSAGEQQSKFSPAYYHVNLLCIRRNWCTFQPADLVVKPQVAEKLTTVHKDFLASLGFFV